MADKNETLLPSNNIQHFIPSTQQTHTVKLSMSAITLNNTSSRFTICTSMFYAICLMLASGFFFGLTAAIIQWGSTIGFDSMEMLMWRSGTQCIIAIISSIITKQSNTEWKQIKTLSQSEIFYLIARGIAGGISVACYFHSVTLIAVGDAVTILSIYPIVAAFCAYFMLNEKISFVHFVALFLAVIGCILISQPSFIFANNSKNNSDSAYLGGFLVALAGGIVGGLCFPLIVKAKRSGTTALICSQGLGCFTIGVIMGLSMQTFHSLITFNDWLLFASLSTVGFLNQWTLNTGARLMPAALSSLLRSTDTLWGYILQIIWFHQLPNWITAFGAVLVICGVVVVSIEKLRKDVDTYKKMVSHSDLMNDTTYCIHYTPVASAVSVHSGLIPPLMSYHELRNKSVSIQ